MENVSPSLTTAALLTDAWNVTSDTLGGGGGQPSIPFAFRFFRIALSLQRVWPPILLCAGTFGNVMTVVIMRRMTSSGDSTIHIYFTAIAVLDLLYLWTIVVNQVILYNFDFDFKVVNSFLCKVFTWLYTGGGTVSCWYLVCMTVHRAVSVVWPHRVSSLCTRRTVLVLLAAVTVFLGLVYLHYLLGLDVVTLDKGKSYKCTLTTRAFGNFHAKVFVYIELLVYSALPFILIVLANSILTWRLVQSTKTAGRHLAGTSSAGQAQAREKAANSVTLTVMAVSFTFLGLTLPSTLNFIANHLVYFGREKPSLAETLQTYATSFICNLLGSTNHAVNFYLYCLTGRRFREEFLRLLCCGRAGAPRLFQGSSKDQAASG